ncbi:MAG: M24 family metallopeptidase [Ignavibacteriaceae bacterium]
MHKFNLDIIQKNLQNLNIDGWLMYDFRGSNDAALEILDIPKASHLTRRFFYFIPSKGNPVKIVNEIEAGHLNHLPGEKLTYSSFDSLNKHLNKISGLGKKVAMEYSPNNNIPYISKVDGGTIEYLKSLGFEIKSSGDLISKFAAVWSHEQFEENRPVAIALTEIVKEAFDFICERLTDDQYTNEYEVQQFIMKRFKENGFITDFPPIVGVDANSSNPHYTPDEGTHSKITRGSLVLIDLWAKVDKDDAVWSDITWTGYTEHHIPEKHARIFEVVAEARDTAFRLVESRFKEGKEIRGFEVDDAARGVIEKAGYGKYFFHRTGHSITTELHGSGANMDNYETHDERLILPSTSFSIEPGIYLEDFGIRSEIDVYISPDGKVMITGQELQKEVFPIFR